MTTIASMDELLSTEEGGYITVGNDRLNPWFRTSEGFRRDVFEVPAEYFAGEVARGAVVRGVTPAEGQFYSNNGGYDTVVIQVNDDNTLWVGRFYQGTSTWRANRKIRATALEGTLTQAPEWVASVIPLLRSDVTMREQYDTLHRQHNEAQTALNDLRARGNVELEEFKQSLTAAVHNFMRENSMEGNSPLGDVLAAHGLARPKQQVEVSFTGRVYSTVALPPNVLTDHVTSVPGFESAEMPAPPTAIYTNFNVTRTLTTEAEYGTCACRSFGGGSSIARAMRDQWEVGADRPIQTIDSLSGRLACPAEGCRGYAVTY